MTRLEWRRTWFQVHKWLGLVLAILIVPLCLSGAALVWHDALDHVVEPARFATSGAAMVAPDRYVVVARALARPGERVAQLSYPDGGGPVAVALAPEQADAGRGGPPPRRVVYLDPPTARVLDVAASDAGIVRFLHVLHGSLQIPGGSGRSIVGAIGVAMMLSAFTGLWLWWPTVGRVRRALRWGRHRDLDTNIHQTFGFWIALPLFILSSTGAWISFPAFFNNLTGAAALRGPDRAVQARARPAAATRLTAQQAVGRAMMLQPGAVRSITWPTERKPDWTVAIGEGRGKPVSVADDSGITALAPVPRAQNETARWMRGVHEGSIGGPLWQLIVFLGGLVPAVLAVTGIIMWWRARGWKARSAGKRKRSGFAERAPADGL